MKLNKGDRIMYDGKIFEVAAVVWNSIYLRVVNDGKSDYLYEMDEVYKSYRDVEFLKESY